MERTNMKFMIVYQGGTWKIIRSKNGCEVDELPDVLDRMKKQYELFQDWSISHRDHNAHNIDMSKFNEHLYRTEGYEDFLLTRALE